MPYPDPEPTTGELWLGVAFGALLALPCWAALIWVLFA